MALNVLVGSGSANFGSAKMELEVEIVGEVGSKEAQLRAPAEMTPAR